MMREEILNTSVQYFKDKVDFVQQLQIKLKVKTNASGQINYIVC